MMPLLWLDLGSELFVTLRIMFGSQQVTLINIQEAFLFSSSLALRTTIYKADPLLASFISPQLFSFIFSNLQMVKQDSY